jgi:FkbM family methyltransferase
MTEVPGRKARTFPGTPDGPRPSLVAAARAGAETFLEHMSFAVKARTHPGSVRIDGVDVALDDSWATPVIRSALYAGWYERAEREILRTTLTGRDIYLELGCGTGLLATMAARIVNPGAVTAVDADPQMVDVTRATLARNGVNANVLNVALLNRPATATTQFYVRAPFWQSSLDWDAAAHAVTVGVADIHDTVRQLGASYLMLDIEGGEAALLQDGLPSCVSTVCVDTHSAATGAKAQSTMIDRLIADGFALQVDRCDPPVLLFTRD